MTYNLHPLLVHFPIALLFVYSVIRILPVERWLPRLAWKDIRLGLLVLGLLGAAASLSTGETAEHLTRPNRELVDLHANFAELATGLYAALFISEIIKPLNTKLIPLLKETPIVCKVLSGLEKIFTNRVLIFLITIAALISITLTGMFGSAMIYGTSADPLTAPALKIFGIEI